MFLKFNSDEERREYGGSCFFEIQYCRLKQGTPVSEIVSVDSISNWDYTSLYVYYDDNNEFWNDYGEIFGNGVYSNLGEGIMDFYGIDYYDNDRVINIINRLEERKPNDYMILLEWIKESKNGIYVLGV